MEVLYDMSAMGPCVADPTWRTGIQRVVEEVGSRLIRSADCSITLCATKDVLDTRQFIRNSDVFRSYPLAMTRTVIMEKRLREKLDLSLIRTYKAADSGAAPNLTDRLRRAALHRVLHDKRFDARAGRRAQIYHTPREAIPSEIREFPNLTMFQTVYDLIPLLFPETVNEGQKEFINKIVSALRPDDWVIADSHSAKNDLCNYRSDIKPEHVTVTHLAADPVLFHEVTRAEEQQEIRRRYNIPPDAPYMLSLCTLEQRKNLIHTARSFLEMIDQQGIKDLYLVLAGGKGWMFDQILSEITDANPALRSRILITGYVADEDLAALYSGALAFLFLSLYEGFGLPPLEAMQCGTPVIVSNTSSLPEVVGDAGIQLDPKDRDGLAQAMIDLYRNQELRENLRTRSRERAKQFSWERCTQETIQAYKRALAEQSS